jgi:hypothetical protein
VLQEQEQEPQEVLLVSWVKAQEVLRVSWVKVKAQGVL